MIQFWMDKGIRGFRLDAIDNIVKMDMEEMILIQSRFIHT